ncbi:hypothetical protein WA556_006177, partial [Blastocystis sp. ATCC 50177/Nand II]
MSLLLPILYISLSLWLYKKFHDGNEMQEMMGVSVQNVWGEGRWYLIPLSLFQHSNTTCLLFDIFMVCYISNNGILPIESPLCGFFISAYAIYGIYIFFSSSTARNGFQLASSALSRNSDSTPYCGCFPFVLHYLGILIFHSDYSWRFINTALLCTYLYINRKNALLFPLSVIGILLSPIIPLFISDYWIHVIVLLSFPIALINYFNFQNGTVLPVSEQEECYHFREIRSLQ